nr:glycerate kinase-like [Ciona intestinalis]|eukprot:XP_002131365.1 glycerate kinase-like [Ciona intestinalis]
MAGPAYGKKIAKEIFNHSVSAVMPDHLVKKTIQRCGNQLIQGNQSFNLNLNVFVVGFGKAVCGMCRAVQDLVGDHIVGGVLSVPHGIIHDLKANNKSHLLPLNDGKIEVLEGARYNTPDQASFASTQKIIKLCKEAKESDLILSLVTGGGSALLNSPIHPITISDMCNVVKLLTEKGATIQDMNIVRQQISQVKGGKLAQMSTPATMWSLILSDIIGDPLHLIASGPTVPTSNTCTDAMAVVEKYGLSNMLPQSVQLVLNDGLRTTPEKVLGTPNIDNILVGNNIIAVEAACAKAQEFGCTTLVLSSAVQGEAKDIGTSFMKMASAITKLVLEPENRLNTEHEIKELLKTILPEESIQKFIEDVKDVVSFDNPVCIIGAGESTVNLSKQHGKGGRNQEMTLSALVELQDLFQHMSGVNVCFLSAGTDGQDGPTDAAGAVFSTLDYSDIDIVIAKEHLIRHDSYNFFKHHYKELVTCGMTGTNVMDIHILLLSRSKK